LKYLFANVLVLAQANLKRTASLESAVIRFRDCPLIRKFFRFVNEALAIFC
jgi:hypothetical protein